MNKNFTSKSVIQIEAPASKVWEALVTPEVIKQYLFDTVVTSDWKVGSSITYQGAWDGKAFEDKGTILQIELGALLVSTFWSSLSGLPDSPENHQTIRYELNPNGGRKTTLTVTQSNNKSEEEAIRAEKDWNLVLESMKKVVEGG